MQTSGMGNELLLMYKDFWNSTSWQAYSLLLLLSTGTKHKMGLKMTVTKVKPAFVQW